MELLQLSASWTTTSLPAQGGRNPRSSVHSVLFRPPHFRFRRAGSRPSGSKLPRTACAGGSSRSYAAGGERSAAPPSKVSIPGLPRGDGATVASGFWDWRPKLSVHYERSGAGNLDSPPLLCLPGFGVGTFHYQKQLQDLGRDHRVYALDFLGQGRSLPSEDPTGAAGEDGVWGFGDETEPWAQELVYSMDLWRDQVSNFVQEVIGEPVYVVGNSLGGFVALYFAASCPHLVKGVTLLNATPFWGLLPNPVRSPRLAKLFPWSGTFPLPAGVRRLTELIWQRISDPSSIQAVLKKVYAEHSADVDRVFTRINEITQHPAAAASFASIMFAPQGELSFEEALSRCQLQEIPICLMYGKEDPWVRPIWGLHVKRKVPNAPYYVISHAGHCPHDEVPEVVNYLIRGWIENLESRGLAPMPLIDYPDFVEHAMLRDIEFLKEGAKKSVKVNIFGSNFSLWKQFRSRFAPPSDGLP